MFAALNVSDELTAMDAEEHTRELQVSSYNLPFHFAQLTMMNRLKKGSKYSRPP
jgi:hypothetical protein